MTAWDGFYFACMAILFIAGLAELPTIRNVATRLSVATCLLVFLLGMMSTLLHAAAAARGWSW